MPARRYLMDITYTRLQARTLGITRTVRRFAAEMPSLVREQGASFVCVAFDGRRFREVSAPDDPPAAIKRQAPIFAVVTGVLRPLLEQVLRLPWPLIRPLWAWAGGLSFRQAVKGCPPVQFSDSDVLLLFDCGSNYAVDRASDRARREGAAVVTMVYDLMPLQEPRFCVPWVRQAFADWLARAVRGSDAMVCISRFSADSLRREAQRNAWRLPATSHVRLGCDVRQSVGDAPVRAQLRSFLSSAHCYACIGSIEPKKNHGLLLDAFEDALAQGCDAHLLVIGRRSGECEDVIARFARHQRETGRVMLVHDATDAEVAYAYEHCRALVLPSLYEGFGLPLVEARALGCPVFASDLAVFHEVADEGVRWFDPREGSTLTRLMVDDAAAESGRSCGRMASFSWRDSTRECLQIVDALLKTQVQSPRVTARADHVSFAGTPKP